MRAVVLGIFLLSLGVSVGAQAESFVFLGGGVRFDTHSSGVGLTRHYPFRLGGGYHLSSHFAIGADLSRYSYSSGTGNVDILSEHYEIMPWLRASIWEQPSWIPYGMLGFGFQKTTVTTTFQGESSRDEGKLEFAPALGIGTFNRIWRGFSGGAEFRVIYRPWASPRTTIETFFSLGYSF